MTTTDSQRDQQRIAQSRRLRFVPWSSSCPSRLERNRPPRRLQRLDWTDPNLHRFPQGESSESAYGSPANELLIDRESQSHLRIPGTERRDNGAPEGATTNPPDGKRLPEAPFKGLLGQSPRRERALTSSARAAPSRQRLREEPLLAPCRCPLPWTPERWSARAGAATSAPT